MIPGLSVAQNQDTQSDLTPLQLDILKMELSREGVEDFFWPLSYADHDNFGSDLLEHYTTIVKEKSDVSIIPYKLIAKYFIADAVGIFQGDVLRERFHQAGREPMVPRSWRLWPFLFGKQAPKDMPFLNWFKNGPEKTNYTKKLFSFSSLKRLGRLFRLGQGGVSLDGLKIKPITQDVLTRDIITTDRTHIIVDHARQVPEDVVFCRSYRWFDAVDDAEFRQSFEKNDIQTENKIMAAVEALYQQNGITLESHSRQYLEKLLKEGAAYLRVHYNRLIEAPEKLPKKIWTGTGGKIWDLILRLAVVQSGGEATGHDHAMGQGVYDLSLTPFVELWAETYFVTYNETQKRCLEINSAHWPALDHEIPEIKSLSSGNNEAAIKVFPKFVQKKPEIKTIALMATVYDCDFGRMDPVVPNMVALDWQARLITHLREWGYDVIFKVHPESVVMPPSFFEDELGAQIVSEPLEGILDQLDMILFDYVYTTTFRSVLETNIPVTVLDCLGFRWSEGVKEKIEKRCQIVEGGFDKDNRMEIDWAALKIALEKAPERASNDDFAKAFLS